MGTKVGKGYEEKGAGCNVLHPEEFDANSQS